MIKIITVGMLAMFGFSIPVFAAKYKSAVSGKYIKASSAKASPSTTYKTRR